MLGMCLARLGRVGAGAGWMLGGVVFCPEILRAADLTETPAVTNILQVRQLAAENPGSSHFIRLEGNVSWASSTQGKLVFHDSTGAAQLELDAANQPMLVGRRVRLEGNGTIARRGAGFKIGVKGPVVDNNGVHPVVEKSGGVYLKAGHHPIRLDWFNGVERFELEVEYEGPGLARQRIPDSALFRVEQDSTAGTNRFVNGLDYECYEGFWEVLPDFSRLKAVKSGTTAGFDLGVRTRDEHAAVRFRGYLSVPRAGFYTFYTRSDDGNQLFIEENSLRLEVLGTFEPPVPHRMTIGQSLNESDDCQWAEVEGTVTFVSDHADGLELELLSGTGRMHVEVTDRAGLPSEALLNRRVRATGVCQGAYTADAQRIAGTLLVPSGKGLKLIEAPFDREASASTNANRSGLTLLTTAVEVHRLKREEAQRGYPVKFRGVITCVLPEHQAFVLQDSTRGLYVVDFSASRSGPAEVGEFLEVEGTTDPSLFAPIVNAQRVRSLGRGHLPEPVRPNWDQLMNGSLDAQYVEIQGVPTAVRSNGITLLTRDGRINLELRVNGAPPETLAQYEDALVRIRGCLFASWDYVTHEVKAGEVRIYGGDIAVEQPAPVDRFSIPGKTVAELRLFDPQAGVFQRVKVSGQIVHARDAEYFLMQDGHGMRFAMKEPAELQIGDEVEVAGFPELFGGAAPVLREAVARKTGHGPLPAPRILPADDLLQADYDATRVQLQGLLVSVRGTPTDQVLEIQSGVRTFMARLNAGRELVQSLTIGSRLELTGVYAAQRASRAAGPDIASFDLLLGSAADLKVLARPPWWTLGRLLVIVGALLCVLMITVLWITQLHRKVEERTSELEIQIRERQRVEHQREMEQERARIAQDLHDELGSDVTEIGMLAARAKSVSALERRNGYLEQMGAKAREMVVALDEIVWAMNPKHDSLSSLVSYFCLYADQFLGLANISWRFEGPSDPPDYVVNSRHRHQLFLAFREALTNVVRHSGATEVRLNIAMQNGQVRLTIADNGRGLPDGAPTEEMDGVANMRARIEKLGGRFAIDSEAGRGTEVNFWLPSN